jgi:lipooligosaccharide transport system permease protein
VAALLGAVHGWHALWAIPVLFVAGLSFACLGLVMSSMANGYDYFSYYMTLVVTPMFVLSGVFYPVSSLPTVLQSVVQVLPLYHAVELVRPLVAGRLPDQITLHLLVLVLYAIPAFLIAVRFARRRLVV